MSGAQDSDGPRFEFVLENDDSTTRVLTPQGNQTIEELLQELQSFSGKLVVRRVTPPSPAAAEGLSEAGVRPMPTVAEVPGARGEELESTSGLLVSPDPALESAASSSTFGMNLDQSGAAAALFRHHQSRPQSGSEEFRVPPADEEEPESEERSLPKFPLPLPPSSARNQSTASSASVEFTTLVPPSIPGHSPMDRARTGDDSDLFGSSAPRHRHGRRRMHKRTSMRELAQLDSFSDTQGQTTLHRICASDSIDFRRLHDLVERYPDMVKHKDSNGRLALHVLSNNSELINFYEGQKLATKCALLLMDSYPEGIITPDEDGRMPFTYLILKWVEWSLDDGKQNRGQNRGQNSLAGRNPDCNVSQRVSTVISNFNRKLHGMHAVGEESSNIPDTKMSFSDMVNSGSIHNSQGGSLIASLRDSLHKSSNRFPPVMIFDEVEWCFEMLSFGMDHLGGKPLDPGKKVRPALAYNKQRDDRNDLAENIAEIPGLLKTVLLVESKHTRSFILDCSAIRRTIFRPEIIGPWLTTMIRYNKGTSSEIALDFLETLSRLKVEDYVGGYRKAQPKDETEFFSAKLEMYKSVETLGDLIPTLLIAGEEATSKAVTTPLVCFIMNRRMATPFTVGTGIGSFLLHLSAMLAFRQIVLPEIGEKDLFVHFPWMNYQSVIFWVATHHIIFKLCEFVALSRISKNDAKKVVFGWWPLFETSGIVLALWASLVLEKGSSHEKEVPAIVLATILGMLWARMLGFLKVVNEHLATFILALARMLYDIRLFGIVLSIFVLMFGDMFNVVVSRDDDIDCSSDELDPALEEFCSRRSFDSYLRTYAIVVGDFELEQYNGLGAVTYLWFCTTFFGTIVMLNALIAVVTTSYSSSQESSVILFRRARAQFLASHSIMERFIRPSQARWSEKMPTASLTYISLVSLRWILLITWLTGSLWSSLYVFELVSYAMRQGQYFLSIPFILLGIGMFIQLWCSLSFLLAIFVEQIVPSGKKRVLLLKYLEGSTEKLLAKGMSSMYGTDRKDTESGEVKVGPNAEVLARLEKLETLLQQVLTKQEREEEEEMEANFDDVPLITLEETEEDAASEDNDD